jgi:Transposase
MMCLLGQGYVFEEGEQLLAELLGIHICSRQIQRVSEHYGSAVEQQQQQRIADEAAKEQPPVLKLKDKQEPVYMMMDGCMLFSREEGWKEMKLGRIFSSSSCVAVQTDRKQIMQSLYVCHFGGHREFIEKWECYTAAYQHKVFIADGAKWIWNWVEDCCPQAVQILDFFHAVEKIGAFAANQYSDEQERARWLEQQKQRLRNNEAAKIIEELRSMQPSNKEGDKSRMEAIRYYENNISRMQYKTYIEKGYLIGSGAIESAHRNVIQQRLKLSGQRWSVNGAQYIANLRTYRKGGHWGNIVNIIKSPA